MLGRTHLLLGILSYLVFIRALDVGHSVLLFLAMLLASLLPDIDEKHSLIGRHFKLLNWFVKHRGFFHSGLIVICLGFLVSAAINPTIGMGFAFSYTVHLLADSMSAHGVHWLWPLPGRIRGGLKVGGFVEGIIFIIVTIVSVLLAV